MTSIDDSSVLPAEKLREVPLDAAGVRPRDVFGKLPRYAAGKPPTTVDGLESFKLSSNENPLPPLPAVLEAIAAETAINRYPDPLTTVLRTELSTYLGVPAADIVAGAGSLGALNQILAAFAGQNDFGAPDEVIYAWRSFEAYPISVGLAGAAGVQVPVMPDGTHDLDAMIAAVTEHTRVVLLCTPNNPTGPILAHDDVVDFLARVPEHVVVVVDEAYQEFVRRPDAVNGLDLYRKHPNVVVLRTFSKAHGLAGLRVGYSVAQQTLTEHLRISAVPFAVSQIAQHAAVTSLRHIDEVEARVQSIVDERTRVVAGLHDLGWGIPEAEGNFVWLALGEWTQHFASKAAESALSVRAFGSEGVRVSIGEPAANTRFLELCAEYPHRP
ncbi:aminotransferase class I/II-fold pyridoxal phosphate-dependent enzyme [Arthrobacter echini]|uniref:Aminotransferase class I/II-fold pyridoxal phosphate-dependent enzyme n=1 Tax=Arthrobacter echini TaxID=1529066 RepID=A0A4S5EA72_9MICC|nr:histidinol-phosphate transaminase [Arthrobacter echini]THJ68631.1 aminotransferase class I/II-fold pyridoxal phosphate-dependent enzyme [Arthrobacter echini]